MSRVMFKWLLGISLTILIVLATFSIFIWLLANVAGAFTVALMQVKDDGLSFNAIAFKEFFIGFIGSPMFWIMVVDSAILLASIVGLVVKRK